MTQLGAMLDAVVREENSLRSCDFRPGGSDGIAMANCEGGGGNDMFVAFRGCDAIIRRFDHESPASRHAHDDDALCRVSTRVFQRRWARCRMMTLFIATM